MSENRSSPPDGESPVSLTASLEDYLEAVLVLGQADRLARIREIAERVGVSMPSVNTALKRLAEEGLVTHERYGHVTLTRAGRDAARRVLRRHETLRRFLLEVLHLPPEVAEADACRMEHGLHPQTVRRLQQFLNDFLRAKTDGKGEKGG